MSKRHCLVTVIVVALILVVIAVVALAHPSGSEVLPDVELVSSGPRAEACAVAIARALDEYRCSLQSGVLVMPDGTVRPIVRVAERP